MTGNVWSWLNFLTVVVLTALLFLLLVWIFVPLGQIVGRQMNLVPQALTSYSWNLLGSLMGILAFLAVSRLTLPPWIWLGIVLVGFAMLQASVKDRMLLMSLVVPLVLLLHDPSSHDHYTIWTPYQQIEYTRTHAENGDFARGELKVNHTGYQAIVNLSESFLGSSSQAASRGAERESLQHILSVCGHCTKRIDRGLRNRERRGGGFTAQQFFRRRRRD